MERTDEAHQPRVPRLSPALVGTDIRDVAANAGVCSSLPPSPSSGNCFPFLLTARLHSRASRSTSMRPRAQTLIDGGRHSAGAAPHYNLIRMPPPPFPHSLHLSFPISPAKEKPRERAKDARVLARTGEIGKGSNSLRGTRGSLASRWYPEVTEPARPPPSVSCPSCHPRHQSITKSC